MFPLRSILVAIGWLGFVGALNPASFAQDQSPSDFFERLIRPVLIARCLECHSGDAPQGGLSLTSEQAMLKGGEHGPVLDRQQPLSSPLLLAIRREGERAMPPDDPLTESEVASFLAWGQLGFPWPEQTYLATESQTQAKRHWAFQPLQAPSLPPLQDGEFASNPIDHFWLARLQQLQLKPAGLADRRTLIRRVTFDLTGLLPEPREVEAFLLDDQPQAYERLVDRLLASPAYGVHMARDWLDLARFSDTKGYVYAREERFFAQATSYRDWVVQALQHDMPYDQFLQWQVAADLLAPDDSTHWPAMGFMTMGRRFLGVTHDIIDDRIDVIGRGLMGLTVSCARCHDHKYDPISTREYYGLYGVFQNCHEQQVLIPTPQDPSMPSQPLADQEELTKRQVALHDALLQARQAAADRVQHRIADYLMAQTRLDQIPQEGFDQLLQAHDLFPSFVRRWAAFLQRHHDNPDPLLRPWIELRPYASASEASFREAYQQRRTEWSHPASPVHARLLACLPDSLSSLSELANCYQQALTTWQQEWVTNHSATPNNHPSCLSEDDADYPLWRLLFGVDGPCQVPDESIVTTESFFETKVCEQLWKLQGEVDRWLLASVDAPTVAQVLRDRKLLQEPRIFLRGSPANPGVTVQRQFLDILADHQAPPFQKGSGRLELIGAITSPDNPLTPRVWVNRLWQHHFGAGLVKTASDFGLRAEPPSHPELLDWLARHLIDSGWSTKTVQRAIVTSELYRQAAVPTQPAWQRERDPENRGLAYQSLRRMRYEEMRDVSLQVCGQLDRRIGGRSQPVFDQEQKHYRRSLYGRVDRQFLDSHLRVFDFANPDLHIPKRSETITPQQALFLLNHPFTAESARALHASLIADPAQSADRINELFQRVYQRLPSPEELESALAFVQALPDPNPTDGALHRWEQLAQLMLISNEFLFVD